MAGHKCTAESAAGIAAQIDPRWAYVRSMPPNARLPCFPPPREAEHDVVTPMGKKRITAIYCGTGTMLLRCPYTQEWFVFERPEVPSMGYRSTSAPMMGAVPTVPTDVANPMPLINAQNAKSAVIAGSVVGGVVSGAIVGLLIGLIADEAGWGAFLGAAVGGTGGYFAGNAVAQKAIDAAQTQQTSINSSTTAVGQAGA